MRSASLTPGPATRRSLLALLGFGTKAGIVPLHVWLPMAHPVAPSHVSALMSGVVIKMGVYGLLRVTIDLLVGGPAWWGGLVLGVGHRLGAPRRALRADGARPQAAARLSLGREHRDHLHRDRGGPDVPELRADDARHARHRRRPVSHDQSRVLQGAAVPGRRVGAARDGHAQHGGDGRADQADAPHRVLLPPRARARSRRCRRSTASPPNGWCSRPCSAGRRSLSPRSR